jgi:hypothetical protein
MANNSNGIGNNNSNNMQTIYGTIYNSLTGHNNISNITFESGKSMKGDNFKKLKIKNNTDKDFDIYLNVWENTFRNCGIIQIMGISNGDRFQIFYKVNFDISIHNNNNNNNSLRYFEILDFQKEKCKYIYSNQHKVPNITADNFEQRKRIHDNTNKLLTKFSKLLNTIFPSN